MQAVMEDPPDWLIVARQKRSDKQANRQRRRERESIAKRLGVAVRVVKDRGITPGDVCELLAAPPGWLIAAQEQRQVRAARERADAQRRAAREARELELAEAYLRAIKDRGDTDAWAAGVLHDAGIHSIDLGDGTASPVLSQALKVVR
ncbi:hypothetical protein AU186_22330 [Mycobacterium sp. GA-1999]|nr:hypothetical protein AU186_22330 [Mycobacterium sp. GA-1999]KUH91360.1 hypothetical protein AU185_09395 [Mycobacterium sp. GA-0227b]KUH96385.1 hypothetical protein AU187_14450 [Mycobacterium sp. IS-1556]